MTVLTPQRPLADLSLARAALEQHWALAAIAPERRVLLLERVAAVAPSDEATLGMPIAESLAMLATAYEIAALGHLDAALAPGDESATAELARESLAMGAGRAFHILRTLQLAPDSPELAARSILRLAAQAVVGRQNEAFDRWADRAVVHETLATLERELDQQSWDVRTRHLTWLAWIALLRHPDDAQLTLVRERLALLRELRMVSEAPFLAGLSGAPAMHARFHIFVTRQLAESAELLASTLHRRTGRAGRNAAAALTLHFSVARSATSVGHGLDHLLTWVHAAAVTIAGGVTDQLELPGM